MENKFLCLMAGYDDDTENYLAGIQKKLYAAGLTGQHTKDIPQHITLQTYPPEQEAEVVQMVKKIAAETEPFKVCFAHIGIFTGGKVLFIATGALLSTVSSGQGESIPCISHAVVIENVCAE